MTPNLDQERVERAAEAIERALFGQPANDLSEVARAAITAYLGDTDTSGWQDIATAPKDGSTILVYFKQHGWMTVRWTDGDGDSSSPYAHWHVDDHKHGPYPVRGYSEGDDTHWQPLPTPPATPTVNGKDKRDDYC